MKKITTVALSLFIVFVVRLTLAATPPKPDSEAAKIFEQSIAQIAKDAGFDEISMSTFGNALGIWTHKISPQIFIQFMEDLKTKMPMWKADKLRMEQPSVSGYKGDLRLTIKKGSGIAANDIVAMLRAFFDESKRQHINIINVEIDDVDRLDIRLGLSSEKADNFKQYLYSLRKQTMIPTFKNLYIDTISKNANGGYWCKLYYYYNPYDSHDPEIRVDEQVDMVELLETVSDKLGIKNKIETIRALLPISDKDDIDIDRTFVQIKDLSKAIFDRLTVELETKDSNIVVKDVKQENNNTSFIIYRKKLGH